MTPQVHDKLRAVAARYDDLTRLVSDPAVQANPQTYKTHAKELAELESLVDAHRKYGQLADQLAQARDVASSGDAEMKALAEEEIEQLERDTAALEEEIKR